MGRTQKGYGGVNGQTWSSNGKELVQWLRREPGMTWKGPWQGRTIRVVTSEEAYRAHHLCAQNVKVLMNGKGQES